MTASNRDASPVAEAVVPSAAELYERFAVPALFAPAAERLLATARPQSGERVLDVGTGTGIAARLAAPRVGPTGNVAGLDADGAMLEVARAVAAREGLAIDWYQGVAERLPFPDASFDLVLSQYTLMFVRDVPAALAEMRRVLVPGGRLAVSVFQGLERHPFYAALELAIARRLGVSTVAAIFALGNADALEDSLKRAGFRDIRIDRFSWTVPMGPPDRFLAGEIAIDAAALPAMQGMTLAAQHELAASIAPEMAEPLQAVAAGDQVVMPFHDLVAVARG